MSTGRGRRGRPDPAQGDLFAAASAASPTSPSPSPSTAATAPPMPAAPAPAAEPGPFEALAEGYARQVRQWAVAAGADESAAGATAAAARALSIAIAEGHVCLPLDTHVAPEGVPALRAQLLGSGVVAAAGASAATTVDVASSTKVDAAALPGACPMVLDDGDRLYLHRDWDHERRLAARLWTAASAAPPPLAVDAARAALAERFPASAAAAPQDVDWQQVGAAMALLSRLTVISGGPGTGKTTTVVALLAALLAQDPQCRIVLAAPTGKAAARMTDAIRSRAQGLPPALQARLPSSASTVHRLLGVRPDSRRFVHDAQQPLALDVLIVDEASMLDLALARRLLDAVPPDARVVLLGDKDQLAAVESGAVFAELSADPRLSVAGRTALAALCGRDPEALQPPPPVRASVLRDCVVWFTRNFRFDARSPIGRLAADIRRGDAVAMLATLGAHGGGIAAGDETEGLRWLQEAGALPGAACREAIRQGYAGYLQALLDAPHEPAALAAAFDRFRVLCALRRGPRGTEGVNAWWTAEVRAQLTAAGQADDPRSAWYAGRPVMVLRNDPVLRLYNGDIGLAARAADGGWQVWFPAAEGGHRAVPALRLPLHDTAWAMTVHKSQGSEFDGVMVLLPAAPHRVTTRELVYTGVTRARQRVTVVGDAAVLRQAVDTPTRRHSGLLARLREVAAADGPASASTP